MMIERYQNAAEAACSALFAQRPGMRWSVHAGQNLDEQILDGAERLLIGRDWSGRRRDSFILGRAASADVVARCNGAGSVLRGQSGEPHWPSGITGSIAHKDTIAVAIGTTRAHPASPVLQEAVGIDIEFTHEHLPTEAWNLFLSVSEMSGLLSWRRRGLTRTLSSISRLTPLILFSLKESVIKAVTHACGSVMSLDSFWLEPAIVRGMGCSVRLPTAFPPMRFALDFAVRRPIIISYCHVVPAAAASSFVRCNLRTDPGGY